MWFPLFQQCLDGVHGTTTALAGGRGVLEALETLSLASSSAKPGATTLTSHSKHNVGYDGTTPWTCDSQP